MTASDPQPGVDEPRVLPLVALRETVIFPEMIVPLQVGREKSVKALDKAVAGGFAHRPGHAAPGRARGHRRASTSCTRSARWPRSPRSCRPRTAPCAPSCRASSALRLLGFESTRRLHLGAHPGAAGRDPAGPRGRGARAHRAGPDRAVRPVGRARAARGGRGGAQHHRAGPAGGHGRLQPGHDHRAAPGAARDAGRRRAPEARLRVPGPPDRDPRAQGPHPVRGQVGAGQEPARVHPARAAEGHPARAGRGRPAAGRGRRAAREGRGLRHARGGQGARAQGSRPHEPHPHGLAGGRRHPHLRGLAGQPALGQVHARTTWTSSRPPSSSTRTTTASRRSRSASSSTSPCARWRTPSAAPSWPSWARPAWARPRWASPSRGPWAASSCA